MKRPAPTPATEDTFYFTLSGGHAFRVERLATGDKTQGSNTLFDFDTSDSVTYVVRFRPALTEAQAAATILSVTYEGDKEVTGGPLVFTRPVRPPDGRCLHLTLRAQELEFLLFETHQLRVGQAPNTYCALYLTLENTQCEAGPLMLGPQLDMHLFCMPELLPRGSTFLRWFPPDVDPAQWGLRIDPRRIPQRTPLWFKMRAELSGSVAVKRVGYFPGGDASFSALQRSAMRLGSQSEDVVLLLYLGHYGASRHFTEVGTCAVPGRPGWGASPDGILVDATMRAHHFPPGTVEVADATQGVCEFKTSRTKLCMEPYFYPQLYMEMMALNVAWADLVRYKPARTWNAAAAGGGGGGGAWEYHDTAHVYRIYRSAELEAWLVRILATPSPDLTDAAALRDHLAGLASAAQPVATLQGNELVARYREHRAGLLKVDPSLSSNADGGTRVPAWWLEIESRTAELGAALRSGVALNKRVVAAQIQAYAAALL